MVAALVAVPVAALVFRLQGAYFAIGSWVVAAVFRLCAAQLAVLGGGSGISLPAQVTRQLGGKAVREASIYWAVLVIGVGCLGMIYLLLRFRIGPALTAIRDSEVASLGIGIASVKYAVYITVAGLTAMIGALIALQKLRLSPEASFSVNDWTAFVIFIVVIGGIGTVEGPVIGTLVYFLLREFLADYGTICLLLLGALAIVVILAAPRGLWGYAAARWNLSLFPVGYRITWKAPTNKGLEGPNQQGITMADLSRKRIITCAITGAIHTPTMSDALPYTADDITAQAIAAAEAGAAILHLHARRPEDGGVSIDPGHFAAFLPRIKQATNAVVNISTGGSLLTSVEDRIAPASRFSPEMCSLNMGSMNFAFHPLAKRYRDWKFDWEQAYVENSDAYIFRNTFRDIATVANALSPKGIKFEHEIYDVGHLYNLRFCMDTGLFKAPVFLQFVLGILGGIGADVDNLIFMKRTADRLFGTDYRWSVLGAGGAQMGLAATAAQMGGNVRVGLEDSLYIARGKLAASNAEQVSKIRRIIEDLGCEVATPDEAREILALKGADRVGF